MRKPTITVAVTLALLFFLIIPNCYSASRKDVLVVGMATSDLISLDPAKAFEFSGVGIINQVYDKLLDFPAGRFDKPELSLAESWKVSDDGKVWTFKLREGVKFHSGNEVTAEDVVAEERRKAEVSQPQPEPQQQREPVSAKESDLPKDKLGETQA